MAVKIRERKGRWWVFIDYRGKRKAKCVGDKRTATTVAQKIVAKLALGDLGVMEDKERRPFDAYFRAWLDTYVRAHCKDSTYAGYEAAFRLYLAPAFGQKDVTEISREDVKQLAYGMLAQGKSRAYVKCTLAPLSEMFNHAVEDGHLARNPALRIMRRSRTEDGERRERATFLSREELARLLEACREHYAGFHPFVMCLARTGMRIGEAVGLQWRDIDFGERSADVKRAIVDGRVTTPKSGKSRRVDLSAQLMEVLKTLHVTRKRETLRHGWKEMPTWVFVNDAGNPLDPDNFRNRVWARLLSKAGLRQIRIHDRGTPTPRC